MNRYMCFRKIVFLVGALVTFPSLVFCQAITGTKTVANFGDYFTISEALTDIKNKGISGNVYLKIDPSHTYNEQVTFSSFTPNSSDTLFVQSAIPGQQVVFQYANATSTLDDYIIRLTDVKNVVFDEIFFTTSPNTSFGQNIDFKYGTFACENITFNKCNFTAIPSNMNSTLVNVDNNVQSLSFFNNKFNFGQYAFYVSLGGNDITFEGNEFNSQYYEGVYIAGNFDFVFRNNYCNSASSFLSLIYLTGINGKVEISNNDITWHSCIAIASSSNQPTVNIYNNFFTPTANSSDIYLFDVYSANIFHNTFRAYSNAIKDFIKIKTCGNGDYLIKNNLFIFDKAGSSSSIYNFDASILSKNNIEIDYNGIFSPQKIGILNGTNYLDMNAWTTSAKAFDTHSVNAFDSSITFNNNWFHGTSGFHITCELPKMYRRAIYLDQKYEYDYDKTQRKIYPAWVGAEEKDELPNEKTSIYGNVKCGSEIITSGKMYLYADLNENRKLMDVIDSTDINPDGSYLFSNIESRDYTLLTVPNQQIHPNRIPTYYGGHFQWQTFFPASADTCGGGFNLDVNVDSLENIASGNNSVEGYIYLDVTTNKTSDPIPGLDVVLDKIPPAKSVKTTKTDANGYFIFNNLPNGYYQVKIDFTGLGNDSVYSLYLNDNSATNINYCVDTAESVAICGATTNILPISTMQEVKLSVFPNPVHDLLNIVASGVAENTTFNYFIYDISGRILEENKTIGNGIYRINTSNYPSGIYFVNLQNEGKIETYKIVK